VKSRRAVVSVSMVISDVGVMKKCFSSSALVEFTSTICNCIIGSLRSSGMDLPDGR